MLHFKYQTYNGVLKYLYQKNPSQYWDEVKVYASDPKDDTPPRYAIDMDYGTRFVPKINAPQNNTFTLCFTNYFLYITKYEIQTSAADCIAKGWRISASNDETNWEYPSDVEYTFQASESHDFDWNCPGFFRCFQIMNTIESLCSNYRFDLIELELFGYLIRQKPSYLICTKYSPLRIFRFSLLLIPISLL